MRRFYCPNLPPADPTRPAAVPRSGTTVTLDAAGSRHAAKVMRIQLGDRVRLFDGAGLEAEATVVSTQGGTVALELLEAIYHPPPVPRIDVAVAVPKGPRLADLVQGLSQAGADGLIPLRSDRGVVAVDGLNRDRLQRVAVEAAKQCGRLHLLTIAKAATLQESLAGDHDLRLFGAPSEQAASPAPCRFREARQVLILIGPEGGWSPAEAAEASDAGVVPWQFGPHVMRIEIAGGIAAAIARYLAVRPCPT